MRTRRVVASVLASASILAAGWELGLGQAATEQQLPPVPVAAQHAPPAAPSPGSSGTSSGSDGSGPSGTGSAPSTPTGTAVPAAGSYTGQAQETQYGAVQVRITIAGGKITEITPVRLTDRDQRSVSISNRAAPILRQEILGAQSANVQTVSGATYTSAAYLSSLQSALDQAG